MASEVLDTQYVVDVSVPPMRTEPVTWFQSSSTLMRSFVTGSRT